MSFNYVFPTIQLLFLLKFHLATLFKYKLAHAKISTLVYIISELNCLHNLLGQVMRKSDAICEQQRHRSACASAQSDQHLCCSLLKQYGIIIVFQSFNILAIFCSFAG